MKQEETTKIFVGHYHDVLRKSINAFMSFDNVAVKKVPPVTAVLFPIPGNSSGNRWTVEVSTQIGCPVGCAFCNMGTYYGNLGLEHVLKQAKTVIDLAEQRSDFDVANEEKMKLSFTDGGEIFLNSYFARIVEGMLSLKRFNYLKFSSTMPDSDRLRENMRFLLRFPIRNHPDIRFHLQVSLLASTDEARRKIAKAKLMPIREIAEHAERFYEATGRKVTLTFTMFEGIILNPADIAQEFDPQYIAIRLYAMKRHAKNSARGLTNADEAQALVLVEEFIRLGYFAFYASSPQELLVGYDDASNEDAFLKYGERVL